MADSRCCLCELFSRRLIVSMLPPIGILLVAYILWKVLLVIDFYGYWVFAIVALVMYFPLFFVVFRNL